jgi:hypothetical protein
MKTLVLWDWFDFGIVLKFNKLNRLGDYKFAVDIQIAWFNLWVQFWRTNKCKYIKRIGESCSLNNNCKFPNCK